MQLVSQQANLAAKCRMQPYHIVPVRRAAWCEIEAIPAGKGVYYSQQICLRMGHLSAGLSERHERCRATHPSTDRMLAGCSMVDTLPQVNGVLQVMRSGPGAVRCVDC